MCVNRRANGIAFCATAIAVLLTTVMFHGEALGIRRASVSVSYEERLFNTSQVHEINIVMEKWEDFLASCEDEAYAFCSVVIDGEWLNNVGIRAKGNTSLANVRMMDSQRYSLKLEFDRYQTGNTYYGLDKLCLNNLIQDNTYMKDYLTFRMMDEFGVPAPLCAYVRIKVNGEPWGLFLAIEGVEESFLQRNYGHTTGSLYKPDAMGFGAGPGNGRNFKMDDFLNDGGFPPPPDMGNGGLPPPDMGEGEFAPPPGMGSQDVMLQYIDDNPSSYANIFSSAKTPVSRADEMRLIRSLKTLSESLANPGEDSRLDKALSLDEVLRYFVAHNYTVNGDSYTGGMIHNYYLYEEDGRLSMIPWDYNLAFGCFQGRNASTAVNDPIDTPLSVSGDGSRPIVDWILKEPYLKNYHRCFRNFLKKIDPQSIISHAYTLISPYAALDESDPTHFCSREEFELGVKTLREFCRLRTRSLEGQLRGEIPSTDAGQKENGATLTDASSVDIAAMGTMGGPGGSSGNRPPQ